MPSLMLMVASDAEFHTEHMTELQLKAEVNLNKLCAWRQYAPAPLLTRGHPSACAPLSRRNVVIVSHAQHVLTVTAAPTSRVKAALSKAAW